jgi:hypothetical protein
MIAATIRTLALAAALAPAAAVAQGTSPCAPDEIGITACKSGRTEYRVIRGTLSPGKHYALAWSTEGKSAKDFELLNGNARYAGDDGVPTFVIRLADGKPLAKLATRHRGDAQSYNHLTLHATWSPDESWLIASSESKWHTDSANVVHIGKDGVSAPLNPLPVCLDAERRGLKTAGKRVDFKKFEQSMQFKLVGNDGAAAAVCLMQIPKQDEDYTFLAQIKLSTSGKGVTAKLGSVKRCPELEGDCALPDIPVE